MALFLALGKTSAAVHSHRNPRKQDGGHGGITALFASKFVVEAREQESKGRGIIALFASKFVAEAREHTSTDADFNEKRQFSHHRLKNVEVHDELRRPGSDASDDDPLGYTEDGIPIDAV